VREFDFLEPTSLAEASALLRRHGDDARAWAGGSALMLAMRQRMLAPTHVISLAGIDALRGITWDATRGLRIGALTRHEELARSPLAREHLPMLATMASQVANPQVRNQGTLGGNLCYADPATDPPSCLMALDARVLLASDQGERSLPITDFLVDYYTTALEPGELLVAIEVPPLPVGFVSHYSRFLRTAAEHRPLVNVALATRQSGGRCEAARLVVGASVPVPMRVGAAEQALIGRAITPAVAQEVADLVAQGIEPLSDGRGSADFRREMVRVVARRTIETVFRLTPDTARSPT
jgi:carbon-monoxide dehydrogenase medium subunit